MSYDLIIVTSLLWLMISSITGRSGLAVSCLTVVREVLGSNRAVGSCVYCKKQWFTTGAVELWDVQSSSQIVTINKPTPNFLQADFLPVAQPTVKVVKERILYFTDLFTPIKPGVFQLCLWPLKAPIYLGGGSPCLLSALWCQYPKCTVYSFAVCNISLVTNALTLGWATGRSSGL